MHVDSCAILIKNHAQYVSLTSEVMLFCIIHTLKLRVLTCVYNLEINFSSKGHSKQASTIVIDNLKKPACASKQDGLVFTTLEYSHRSNKRGVTLIAFEKKNLKTQMR